MSAMSAVMVGLVYHGYFHGAAGFKVCREILRWNTHADSVVGFNANVV